MHLKTRGLRMAAAVATGLGLVSMGLAAVTAPASAASPDYSRACGTATRPDAATCLVLVRTDVRQRSLLTGQPTGYGYGPADLQNAYLLPSSSAGNGQTVAIVDAYDDPEAAADLAAYRTAWGLPPCTTASGCFSKVNEQGQASPLPPASGSTGWATEESLDLDMVSAICPNCRILLVEASTSNVSDLGTGVNSAVRLGAKFVSNSYGTNGEYSGETSDDTAYYNHPGVVVTASAGDSGYAVDFPAASPNVVSVGGTSLSQASGTRGWSETAWDRTGSGCSQLEPKPSWQADSGCAGRTVSDVSAVADPNTGVAIYDSYDQHGWLEVGGTSASAPLIAGVYALAGTPAAGSYPASYLYAHAADLFDVTSGSNGSCSPAYLCTAGAGYDGPTGLGTPDGIAGFGKPSGNIVTVANPGDQQATQDEPFSLQVHAIDSAAGQTLGYTTAGLPPGLSISQSTGLISGTPTATGIWSATITATDQTGASGYVTVSFSVASPVSLTDPGPQAASLGQPMLLPVTGTDAVGGRTLRYSAVGLPTGLSINAATGTITGLVRATGYFQPVLTATDSAGRTSSVQDIWYVQAAQASGRAGSIRLGTGHRCLTGSTAVTTGTCGQSWAMAPNGTIRSQGECLQAAGTSLQLAACGRASSQQWRVATRGELVNLGTGHCVTAGSGSAVGLESCAGTAGQLWSVPAGPLVSAITGLCADSGAGCTGDLQVWYCGNTSAQAWQIRTDGTVADGSSCMTVSAHGVVALAACGGAAAQQWQVTTGGRLVNPATGKCLADPGDSLITGTALAIRSCAAHPGQLWHVE